MYTHSKRLCAFAAPVNRLASLPKWLNVCLQTKCLYVPVHAVTQFVFTICLLQKEVQGLLVGIQNPNELVIILQSLTKLSIFSPQIFIDQRTFFGLGLFLKIPT